MLVSSRLTKDIMIRYLLLLVVAWESLASHSVGYITLYPNNSRCTGAAMNQMSIFSEACYLKNEMTIYGTSPTITFYSFLSNCSLSGLINYYSDNSCQTLVYQSNSVCGADANDDYLIVCGPAPTTTPTTTTPTASPTASPIRPK